MSVIPVVALLVTAGVHAIPASLLFRPHGMENLYGGSSLTPEMVLLLRHRAGGFATLVVMSVVALFVQPWRTPVLIFALGSVALFVVLWWRSDVRTPAMDRVAYADMALLPVIVAGLALS